MMPTHNQEPVYPIERPIAKLGTIDRTIGLSPPVARLPTIDLSIDLLQSSYDDLPPVLRRSHMVRFAL